MFSLSKPKRKLKSDQPLARRRVLALAFGAFAVVFLLWQSESMALYPFRLMVTFVHEAGHGIAAIISGGQFISFHIFPDGSGLAYTDGGNTHLILLAGYVGTALFGAALLYAANRVRRVEWVSYALGAFFVAVSLLFAGGGMNIDTALGSMFAIIIGMMAGMCMIALGYYASRQAIVLGLNTLAFIIGFNVVSDFLFLFSNQDVGIGEITNDAAAMAALTNLPTAAWIVIWACVSIAAMGAAAIFAFVEPPAQNQAIRHTIPLPAPESPSARPTSLLARIRAVQEEESHER